VVESLPRYQSTHFNAAGSERPVIPQLSLPEGERVGVNAVGLADVARMELAESGVNKPANPGLITPSFHPGYVSPWR